MKFIYGRATKFDILSRMDPFVTDWISNRILNGFVQLPNRGLPGFNGVTNRVSPNQCVSMSRVLHVPLPRATISATFVLSVMRPWKWYLMDNYRPKKCYLLAQRLNVVQGVGLRVGTIFSPKLGASMPCK